jgi:hypothetical protein
VIHGKAMRFYEYKFVAIFTFLIPIKTKGHIPWRVMDKHGEEYIIAKNFQEKCP